MYIIVSRLRVAHYNAQQDKDLIMPVPIHAAVMFGHALGARLGKAVRGVALVLHEAQVEEEYLPSSEGGGKRLLANKRGAATFHVDRTEKGGGGYARGKAAAMSYQMHASVHGCFSLALDFGDAAVSTEHVKEQLRTLRFAGGTLANDPRIVAAGTRQEVLAALSSGYFVMDAAWRAQRALDAGYEPAHVFYHRHPTGYVVPAVVGYHQITPVSDQRLGMRRSPGIEVDGHAFAESVIGLIEFQHVNRFKFKPPVAPEPSEPPAPEVEDDTTDEEPAADAPTALAWALNYDDTPPLDRPIFWHHSWHADDTCFLIHQS